MRKYTLGNRLLAMLLLAAMIFSMVPAMQLGASAAITTATDGKTYEEDQTRFLTAAEDGITMLNNGQNISLSIKVNNFVNDGMLFEYLSSARSGSNAGAHHYLWEYCKDDGKAFVQLYPYKLRYDINGETKGVNATTNLPEQGVTHGLADSDGFVGVTTNGTTLDTIINYGEEASNPDYDNVGTRSDGVTKVVRTLLPLTYTENGRVYDGYTIPADTTAFIRLDPLCKRDANGNNPDGSGKGRAWTKLTTFANTQKVDDIRYAVVIYRLPYGPSSDYSNFGLTVNCFDEAKGSCSKYVKVDTEANSNWQYAIIDLMGLGADDARRIASGTSVNEVYLQSPLYWNETGNPVMDIAAVGYFPYYGDAEQFAYYGLTLGCKETYFNSTNSGFTFRTGSRRNGVNNTPVSLPDWVNARTNYAADSGFKVVTLNTYEAGEEWYGFGDNTSYRKLTDIDLIANNEIGYTLFGEIKGAATIGLLESSLDENGRPQYKQSVVDYLSTYLRYQLMTNSEYPSDNNGWRNYAYITGASTSGGTDEALFGKNEIGQSIDLATAICTQLGIKKGALADSADPDGGYTDALTGAFGSYAKTMAHADELIGTWDQCKDNIKTWHDAAYYLLHNLYVTETDAADAKVDGYGEYEDDYQSLILPQVSLSNGTTAYFFDSGYSYNKSYDANGDGDLKDYEDSEFTSALTYDKTAHTITLNGDAEGKAQFCDIQGYQTFASYFPFLLTSGNGTQAGESNNPYYLHGGALSRYKYGSTYRDRDFHYALSGSGYFVYKEGLYFDFEGDDDVYVFINGELVVDIGGTHSSTSYNMDLDEYVEWARDVKYNGATYKDKTYAELTGADKARVDNLALVEGGSYSFDFFYMERHGVGSNLRIITNMEIAESGLDVDKFAYQNGIEVVDNGMVDVDQMIEYGFSITNNADGKLYDLTFSDPVIGVSIDSVNGLTVTGNVTNEYGSVLVPSNLVITVDGYTQNEDGTLTKMAEPVYVTCMDNEALKEFVATMSADGTESGDVATDYSELYSGSGLWKDATVSIRGIYYTMSDAQKEVASFTNSVNATGSVKVPSGSGIIENYILRGTAKHTVYQPGKPAYYQWVGHPIYLESERLYNDLIDGKVVEGPGDLPYPGNMILIPSNATGTELSDCNVSNTKGGNVYLKINYTSPGSYMAYVTIHDKTDANYSITVPITIYAVGGQDSIFVLDYGLDTFLTENEAIFDYELDAAVGNVTGTVMGIAADNVGGYSEYKESLIAQEGGQTINDLTLVSGTYDGEGDHTKAVYQYGEPVYLDHNKPWVLEWKANHGGNEVLLFSNVKTSTSGNRYVYINTKKGNIYLGEHNPYHDGSSTSNTYNNYGITDDTAKSKITAAGTQLSTYRLVNEPDGAGGNMVYLYLMDSSGVFEKLGALNNYHYGNTYKDVENNEWLSGKDFTFNFLGTTGHPIDGDYEYIRVYEDGLQLNHFNWALSGTSMDSVDTGEVGYTNNPATYNTFTYNSNEKHYWNLTEPVSLVHNNRWEISATVSGITSSNTVLLMAAKDSSAAGATHIYLAPNSMGDHVCMGYRNPSGSPQHINFVIDLEEVFPGFDMEEEHTYVFRNELLPTGGNMVYLYVDGALAGPLDAKYAGASKIINPKTTEISGMDFTFHTIGDNNVYGFFNGAQVTKLTIRTDSALKNTFEWVPGEFSMESYAHTDPAGNQITFTKDADGVIESTDGKFILSSDKLKFEVEDFMDERYSAYIAMTIHEKGFVPSRLEDDAIDIGKEVQLYKKVTVLPANVVYYEDDFPKINYMGTKKNTFTELTLNLVDGFDTYTDTYYMQTGSSEGLTQSPDQDTPYGSDETYSDISANVSGGTLHTIAINNDGPLAWFSFKGTGFEIDARTNATDSGALMIEVYNKADFAFDENGKTDMSKAIKVIPVISEFDNGNTINGSFQGNNGGAETIYQVPLIQYKQDTVAELVVVITGIENIDYYNGETHIDSYLYLDGIRIFSPLGSDATYEEDGIVVDPYGDENKAVFEEFRNHIIDGNIITLNYSDHSFNASTGTLTWTEKYNNKTTDKFEYVGSAVTSVNDYLMEGPNNEVYVEGTFTSGAVAFYVRESTQENVGIEKILQIGVRALDMGLYHGAGSTGMQANLQLGVQGDDGIGWTYVGTVTSGTEQYYNVNYKLCPTVTIDGQSYYQVVIKVAAFSEKIPAMVSFTNLKRTTGLEICEEQFTAADLTLNDITGEQVADTETTSYGLLRNLSSQMASDLYVSINEVESGSEFVTDDDVSTDAPVIAPKYPSLSLDGEVSYNIYFETENMADVDTGDMGLMLFDSLLADGTIDDAIDVIPGAVYLDSVGYYRVHTNGIPAKDLGDDIYFKVYAKLADGSYVYSNVYSYNAVRYVDEIFANSSNDEMKALCVAMLNYGAAAQTYFGYKTDALMNAGLTDEQQALVQSYSSDIVKDVAVDTSKVGSFVYSNAGFAGAAPTVSFEGAFSINYYITPNQTVDGDMTLYYWTQDAYDSAAELTAENASGTVTMVKQSDGRYSWSYTDIDAKEVNEAVYIAAEYSSNGAAYCTGVIAYSIGAYCEDLMSDSSDASVQDLAAATALYGHYAEEYFA